MTHTGLSGLQGLLDLAATTAVSAGEVIVEHLDRRRSVGVKSSPSDPLTELDRRSEDHIVTLLDRARPYDGLLSEEGTESSSTSGIRWVIDALDGSVNHLYGIPHCAVSIAAEVYDDGEWLTLAGVVRDPIRGESFTAVRGGRRGAQRPRSPGQRARVAVACPRRHGVLLHLDVTAPTGRGVEPAAAPRA
ncbi:hypothetical protein GCM10009716_41540 [Streptomyces sodiiphilus]|uniref:Inositol monophosphatase n=1 Tax=Streptomyces sodiiphilus TaxID=226217 RepID=A0ABN2PQY5_9ACTN